ncbi:IS3 family transposase [Thiocapsa bogorovii]|uniref:IS3 family transposase n=1 Tax=Thiocapsa bogorovii TaxID=521689 RepID=UPI001E5FA606|nr:IS3 family transposase [Thiocapsa bogorovii]UHD14723.1 IS3 family transposase [Thiocapsa bogorovii]
MTTYSSELKDSILTKLLPPNNVGVPQLAAQTGIPRDTLYGWRREALGRARRPRASTVPAGTLGSEEKFAVVMETATLNELELGAYCRRKGLFAEQISAWRTTCQQANAPLTSTTERAERRAEQAEIVRLGRELQRKDRALAEAATLLVLQKSPGDLGGARGRSLAYERRVQVSEYIAQACAEGARLSRACAAVGLSERTLQRWRRDGAIGGDGRTREHRTEGAVRTPANRLSPHERQAVLTAANAPRFASLSPHQIVPALADEGCYLGSESTFYRVLRDAGQLARRGRAKAPTRVRPQPLEATGPNRVWSWDITYLASTVQGMFFYLYLIMDVYSRKIVGWEVYPQESAAHAASVLHKAYLREGVHRGTLVLHSDNGSPMKGATMLVMLQRLGVVPSFSRPAVSNDNPYSESLFNTVKGRPDFPSDPFDGVEAARRWMTTFTAWYNTIHLHSALKFVTPAQRHRGEDVDLLARRDALYQAARDDNPTRWSGPTRNWTPPASVLLNPGKPPREQEKADTNMT